MKNPGGFLRALACGIGGVLAGCILMADGPVEPRLFRAQLRIEPTDRQVSGMQLPAAEWRVAPSVAENFAQVMQASRISEGVARELQSRLTRDRTTGEGVIAADRALLEQFSESEHARWFVLLAASSSNRSYRWPVALRASILEEQESDPRFREATTRVRRHALRSGEWLVFGDLFVLKGAFAEESDRVSFMRILLGATTEFVKVDEESIRRDGVAETAEYWESSGRTRAVEPFLHAIARIEGHDRVDIAHLLPRLARSLLYTFPPDFSAAGEASVENATMIDGFFDPSVTRPNAMPGGFSEWLRANCEVATATQREFGDIVVFEDPARTKWPFAMIYIADGILFGRRPTFHGPWELLKESDVPFLNPRLRGTPISVYRIRSSKPAAANRPLSSAWPAPSEMKDLPAGPWGRLRYYDVLLAPSAELLETLPAPERRATWTFYGTTQEDIERVIDSVGMPARTRVDLNALSRNARTDRKGLVTVRPAEELVLATPSEFRSQLFPRLVHGSRATDYAQDVLIPTQAGAAEWFPPDLMPGAARDALLKLVYPHGRGLMLSDFGAFYHSVSDPQDRMLALRALYRTPALVLLLERPEPDEVDAIADYWRLDPQKGIARLLQSFAGAEEMRYLDIVHLLPPLARELMNVYVTSQAGGPTPSCYWSSLNFAAEQPDSRLLVTPDAPGGEGREAWKKLQAGYCKVEQAEKLGDLFAYRRKSDGEVIHMCAFVAAGIVYTKNGFGYSSPWCLMRLEDVDALYLTSDDIERLVFRTK